MHVMLMVHVDMVHHRAVAVHSTAAPAKPLSSLQIANRTPPSQDELTHLKMICPS